MPGLGKLRPYLALESRFEFLGFEIRGVGKVLLGASTNKNSGLDSIFDVIRHSACQLML